MNKTNEERMKFLDWVTNSFTTAEIISLVCVFGIMSTITITDFVVKQQKHDSEKEQQLIKILKEWK